MNHDEIERQSDLYLDTMAKAACLVEAQVARDTTPEGKDGDLREFLIVLRRAFLMVSGYIEHRYMR